MVMLFKVDYLDCGLEFINTKYFTTIISISINIIIFIIIIRIATHFSDSHIRVRVLFLYRFLFLQLISETSQLPCRDIIAIVS